MESGINNRTPRFRNVEDILTLLDGVEKTPTGYQANCPVHRDAEHCLSVVDHNRNLILRCNKGCSVSRILSVLNIGIDDLTLPDEHAVPRNGCYSVTPPVSEARLSVTTPPPQSPAGVTVLKKMCKASDVLIKTRNHQELYNLARIFIEAEDPLKEVKENIRRMGYGGDIRPAMLVYLSMTSRVLGVRNGTLLPHLLLVGASSTGKTYSVSSAKQLFPKETYSEIISGSPRSLIYANDILKHKALIFGEADSIPMGEDTPIASAIRSLTQDNYLSYHTVQTDPKSGNFQSRKVEKEGPTVLITTSIKDLPHQLGTRFLSFEMPETPTQIMASLDAQVRVELEGVWTPHKALLDFQLFLQDIAPIEAVVPFARDILNCIPPVMQPSFSRGFQQLLSLMKVVAIVRMNQRWTDEKGRIRVSIDDYATVRELVNDVYVNAAGPSENVRKLVEAVSLLGKAYKRPVSQSTLVNHLNRHKMAVSRDAGRAVKEGWLINHESRKGYCAQYEVAESMPESIGLPTVEQITSRNLPNIIHGSELGVEKQECSTEVESVSVGDIDIDVDPGIFDNWQGSVL
jgi:hypothetical protein